MKNLLLTIFSFTSLFLTVFFIMITFNHLHQTQFNLTFEQSYTSMIMSIMFLIVSIIEIMNNK